MVLVLAAACCRVVPLTTILHVYEVRPSVALVVETVYQMVDYQLQSLLCVKETDSLDVYHVLYCEFLFLKHILLRLHDIEYERILCSPLLALLPFLHLCS